MSNLFAKVERDAFRAGINPRTAQSRDWFRRKLSQMRTVNRNDLMKSEELTLVNKQNPLIGSMNMFFYDAKHKETLPYYDKFPLSVIIGPAKDGFMGLNLHYLPPVLRAKMLDNLMDITNNKKYDETTRFEISYKLLTATAKIKFYKPCLKHYLFRHVKSRLARVPAPEWEIATFLPTADWQKGSASTVYKDSRRMM
tara:strand:+ start:994 stop:1584 length:591 start_codon:yes stop_codon:yes gene_type:complete